MRVSPAATDKDAPDRVACYYLPSTQLGNLIPGGAVSPVFFTPEKLLDPQYLQYYQTLRRQGFGARHALSCLRGRIALDLKCAATGFAWAENRHGFLHAHWQQEGFDLTAAVVNDEDGWWASGVSCIGRFSRRWEPGAVRHRHGDRNPASGSSRRTSANLGTNTAGLAHTAAIGGTSA